MPGSSSNQAIHRPASRRGAGVSHPRTTALDDYMRSRYIDYRCKRLGCRSCQSVSAKPNGR